MFGAYTTVAWPKPPARDQPSVTVPDPRGASVLFSLKNKFGDRPFSIPLVDRTRAIYTTPWGTIGFGGEVRDAAGKAVKLLTVCLMSGGKSAHHADGNFTNTPTTGASSYRIAEWHGASVPDGFLLNDTTLTGSHWFGCAEIEVYAL